MNIGDSVEVQGSSDVYTIKLTSKGYECTCPSFKFKKIGTCKHIDQLLGRNTDKKSPISSRNLNPTLANKWTPDIDPTDMIYSEKLDGMRAIWTGSELLSRQGKPINASENLKQELPKGVMLDGELFLGRGRFQECMSIVKKKSPDSRWNNIIYNVFDCQSAEGGIMQRLEHAKKYVSGQYIKILPHDVCNGREHLFDLLSEIENYNGEGLMLRQPDAPYVSGRTKYLLKVKSIQDDDAIVEGYETGKGKHANKMGALICTTKEGKTIKVGTGFTDTQRETPPPIGSIIVYKYFEITKDGNPRFPSFHGVREDGDAQLFKRLKRE